MPTYSAWPSLYGWQQPRPTAAQSLSLVHREMSSARRSTSSQRCATHAATSSGANGSGSLTSHGPHAGVDGHCSRRASSRFEAGTANTCSRVGGRQLAQQPRAISAQSVFTWHSPPEAPASAPTHAHWAAFQGAAEGQGSGLHDASAGTEPASGPSLVSSLHPEIARQSIAAQRCVPG